MQGWDAGPVTQLQPGAHRTRAPSDSQAFASWLELDSLSLLLTRSPALTLACSLSLALSLSHPLASTQFLASRV